MDKVIDFFKSEFLGIAIWRYFSCLIIIMVGFVAKRIAAAVFLRMAKITEKTRVKFDNIIIIALSKPLEWAMSVGGIFAAIHILPIPEEPVNIAKFVDALFIVALVYLITWICVRLVEGFCNLWEEKAEKTKTKLDDQLVPIVRRSSKVFFYIIGVVLVLQNLGYSVVSLLAGFGIGGAALAFASKDAIANLFGSIIIFLDKPFQIGDWIEVGDIEGTVEDVGLRTIRLRTFANSLITIPNARFTNTAVNNWSRMKKRRIKMTIGVHCSASPEKIEELVLKIRKIITEDEKLHHDFFLVNFDKFGPYSLDIFIYCFTRTTNWAEFLQAKQEFMLDIMRAVYELGLDFAFPTQTVHVESLPDKAALD
jgi:MscS family membrane protein